jgi:8-oxo-dGTP pyrophosphatase MutT (NUDIX family)
MNKQTSIDIRDTREGINFVILKYINNKWHVVMQQRDENSREYKNHWCIPGGGLKDSEKMNPTLAATREAKSETGLDIPESEWQELCNRPANNPGKVFVAVVPPDSKVVRGEGAAMEWKSIAEIEILIEEGIIGYGHEEWLIPKLNKHINSNLSELQREQMSGFRPPRFI